MLYILLSCVLKYFIWFNLTVRFIWLPGNGENSSRKFNRLITFDYFDQFCNGAFERDYSSCYFLSSSL